MDSSSALSGGAIMEDAIAMPSDAFGILLLSTDVDAMSEGGTPALLHVSLDPNSRNTAAAEGSPRSLNNNRSGATTQSGGDSLLNKMLIGGFSTCLKRKRGILLETLVRRLSRRSGGTGDTVNGFLATAHRVATSGADAQERELDSILQDTFHWELEHSRCCVAGLVPASADGSGGAAPLLLCLLVPADVAYVMVPAEILFSAVLWVLRHHASSAGLMTTSQQSIGHNRRNAGGVVEFINACVTSSSTNCTEANAACKMQLYHLLSVTATAGTQLERSARLHELHLTNSAAVGPHLQQHHHLAEWWANVHRMMLMSQHRSLQRQSDEDDDDCIDCVEETIRRHVYQRDDMQTPHLGRSCVERQPIVGLHAQHQQQLFVIQGVSAWKHGNHVYGTIDAATRSKPALLLFAAETTHIRDWSLAQSASSSPADHAALMARWQTPSTRTYVASSEGHHGLGSRPPSGVIVPHDAVEDRVVVGALGSVFMTLWLTPIASSLGGIGCTIEFAVMGLEKSLYDIRDSTMPNTHNAVAADDVLRCPRSAYAWPRTMSLLSSAGGAGVATESSDSVISPIGFEVRVFGSLPNSPCCPPSTLVASYLRHASGYALAPISAYLPDALHWLEEIESLLPTHSGGATGCVSPSFCCRKFVPLLHRRLRFAAHAHIGTTVDGLPSVAASADAVPTATLLLEHSACISVSGAVVAAVVLMPSNVPIEVARRFSSSLIATFSE
jgi:hypothetical protein